jgi:hypothetical protein
MLAVSNYPLTGKKPLRGQRDEKRIPAYVPTSVLAHSCMSTLADEILFSCATRQILDSTKPPELMLRDIVGVFGGASDPCHVPTTPLTSQATFTGHPGVHTQWHDTIVIALLLETRWHAAPGTLRVCGRLA